MPLKKLQMRLDCEHCRFAGCNPDDSHAFYVRVVIEDEQAHNSASALIECKVEPQSHQVQLVELDGEAGAIDRERLERALEVVAEQRLCGNNRICPAEIVRIVEDIQNDNGSD